MFSIGYVTLLISIALPAPKRRRRKLATPAPAHKTEQTPAPTTSTVPTPAFLPGAATEAAQIIVHGPRIWFTPQQVDRAFVTGVEAVYTGVDEYGIDFHDPEARERYTKQILRWWAEDAREYLYTHL